MGFNGLSGDKHPKWVGGRRLNGEGYIEVRSIDHPKAVRGRKYIQEHVLVAEKALGRVLTGTELVHHHDENRSNNANANLVICPDNSYHYLLHARMRVLKAGGDPDTQKLCGVCGVAKAFGEFHLKKSDRINGRHNKCKPCRAETRSDRKVR